jgi:uncharacterized membrane protein (GlpM family)
MAQTAIDLLIRFLVGGAVVCLFSVIGDVLKPKSLGGIFAAAPTIALATLYLSARKHGSVYAGVEARSMVAGAIAFFVYACLVSFALMRCRRSSLGTSAALLPAWAGACVVLWALWLRR